MVITLEDCLIWSEPRGWEDFRNIVFSLHGIMNLYGIKDKINNYQVGHETFKNKFGMLYVACDFCVRYAPKEEALHFNGFEFRSLRGWPEFKGNTFMILGLDDGVSKILESDDKQVILAKIGQRRNLRPYLDSFFNWLNESVRVHGEKFYRHLQETS